MQKMLLIEQSYAASAKVIEAVRDMLDKLLEI
jgi:flagellar hook-associated protein FlgK